MSQLRSKEVLELGAQLVAQLDRKDDLLASWMSHYIAELIEKANTASPESKPAAEEVAAKAILDLWRHRSSLPREVRPFAKLEPVLRTLASLDEENTSHRYYARDRDDAESTADEEMQEWLEFARNIDDTARFLVRTTIGTAVAASAAPMTRWAKLAKSAKLMDNIEYKVLEFARKAYESDDKTLMRQASLQLKLAKIDSFLKKGAAYADVLRKYLAEGAAQADDDESEADWSDDDDEETRTSSPEGNDDEDEDDENEDDDGDDEDGDDDDTK